MTNTALSSDASLYTLGDFGETVAGSAEDVRGREVKDGTGNVIGSVADLLVDDREHKVRFLLVERGGFLGFGQTKTLIPVDAIAKITKDKVVLDQSRKRVAAAPLYDPALVDDRPYHSSIFGYYGYAPFWGVGYGYPTGLGMLSTPSDRGDRFPRSAGRAPGSAIQATAAGADLPAERASSSGSDTNEQRTEPRTLQNPLGVDDSDAEFGQRMESAENEAERFSDVDDVDEEGRNDLESAATIPTVPNMVAAFAQRVKDEPTP
jgi:sporulation protein YlmC with PRC-barrel domain